MSSPDWLARAVRTRRQLRRLRLLAATTRHRWLTLLGRESPRVFDGPLRSGRAPAAGSNPVTSWPGDSVAPEIEDSPNGTEGADRARWLCVTPAGTAPTDVSPTLLELLLISAACSPVPVVRATRANFHADSELDGGPVLLDLEPGSDPGSGIESRTIHVSPVGERREQRLAFGTSAGVTIERPWPVDEVLANLPPVGGLPTVLFVVPFLAVGGAEHLLLDLVSTMADRFRILVVSLDQHRTEIGSTLDRFRRLTPHVYPLGDWLPRSARISALRHLIRRFDVTSLCSWNGTVDFYDALPDLRRRYPRLRILTQIFDHRHGWLDRYTRRVVAAGDVHIAVNGPTATALAARAGRCADRVVTVHHGVEVPPRANPTVTDDLRRRRRLELGLPTDAIVVGTFVRFHAQKRPLDVIRLADRVEDEPFHFLIVGDGPLSDEVDRELGRRIRPNVTRRPMTNTPSPLFDAIDVCLMTSEYEGLPVFLLEGLAREIPFVATGVGDIPLLAKLGGGEVVEKPGDLSGLRAALLRMSDREHRRQMGAAGLEAVREKFSLARFATDYERLIFPEAAAR